jgi:peptidoglycan/LPS O-acetylase OafA/YrhL
MRGRNSTTTNRPLQIPRMTRPATFFSIQALRGIAALMVVLFHLRIVEGKYGQDGNLLGAMFAYADSGVDLFFMLSGFVMTSIAAGSYGSPRNAGDFLARRGWRVLPLYWFYTTLVVALMLLMPGMANSAYQDQSILASYLLWPQAQLPLLTVGWTLIHEAFFYLLMAVAIAFARERQLPWLLLGWAAATLLAHGMLGAGIEPVESGVHRRWIDRAVLAPSAGRLRPAAAVGRCCAAGRGDAAPGRGLSRTSAGTAPGTVVRRSGRVAGARCGALGACTPATAAGLAAGSWRQLLFAVPGPRVRDLGNRPPVAGQRFEPCAVAACAVHRADGGGLRHRRLAVVEMAGAAAAPLDPHTQAFGTHAAGRAGISGTHRDSGKYKLRIILIHGVIRAS